MVESEKWSERRKLKISHAAALRTDCRRLVSKGGLSRRRCRSLVASLPERSSVTGTYVVAVSDEFDAADGGRRSNATQFSEHASASPDRRRYVFRGRGRMTTRKQLYRRSSVYRFGSKLSPTSRAPQNFRFVGVQLATEWSSYMLGRCLRRKERERLL